CFFFAGYLLLKTGKTIVSTIHYMKNEVNKDYNRGLVKRHGGFLGVCLNLVMDDIEQRGNSPNDYRIITYSYDEELVTIPEDTTNTFYSFSLIYRKKKLGNYEHRATAYRI